MILQQSLICILEPDKSHFKEYSSTHRYLAKNNPVKKFCGVFFGFHVKVRSE